MDKGKKRYVDELAAIYRKHGTLDPEVAVEWAREHPKSDLHSRLNWDDTKAAHQYRIWQMRQIIVEVEVVEPDTKKRHQVYVSPIENRRRGAEREKSGGGYVSLVEVLSSAERRSKFLAQALAEYERLGEKYRALKELAGVRAAVARASGSREKRKKAA